MSSMIYDLNGIPVQIEYRRIKNINLYIRPPAGEVLVTAPKGTPSGRIKNICGLKRGMDQAPSGEDEGAGRKRRGRAAHKGAD